MATRWRSSARGEGDVQATYLYKVGDDLVVVGGGDPGLGDPKIAEAKGEKIADGV